MHYAVIFDIAIPGSGMKHHHKFTSTILVLLAMIFATSSAWCAMACPLVMTIVLELGTAMKVKVSI
jgi:hypothetical protein